jgi:uncharacterized DUF497 family protein
MKYFEWNEDKNDKLKKERNISFEIVVGQIELGFLLDKIDHSNKEKYENQSIFVVEFEKYAYLVPFVEDDERVFLKTIIPSRKATRKYLEGK